MRDNRRTFLKSAGVVGLSVAAANLLESFSVLHDPVSGNAATLTYEGSSEVFANPERGFFPQLSVNSERPGLDVDRLLVYRKEYMTLVLRIFYLEKFKDKALSDAQLTLIRSDLGKIREAGMKCILRFAYTNNMEVADAPLHIVEQHLEQLKPVFAENKDIIAFIQAGFIGAWGEWHASSNGLATTENQRKVLFKLLSVLPSEIMVQVRTPGQKQRIFGTTKPITEAVAFKGSDIARTGHHNDCFLTNDTDYGTYSSDNVEGEKQYISDEALYVPVGGETCPPVPKENLPGCEYSTKTMRHLRWTYLHLNYYRPTVNAWKEAGCFEELQRDLGYRLSLRSALLPTQISANKALAVNLIIINSGYAPLYFEKVSNLILKDTVSGKTYEITIPVDIRRCKPLSELVINHNLSTRGIPKGTYNLYLKVGDKDEKLRANAAYAVRLANKDTWDAEGGLNKLNHQLRIV